eukprot:CAMPEP_0175212574 /NCGR_PEP_ID=MMETSP0093-20121207/15747_1 /TAXON_ID=311494 /ORGANISM="Alexandrium monilatum, Strain CCMP3105" /LENGTH=332 /DNA_ID=CAMNT_0016505871 /DNA_START=89 /DNA_END=1084 /DNA_ORIENTATION=+
MRPEGRERFLSRVLQPVPPAPLHAFLGPFDQVQLEGLPGPVALVREAQMVNLAMDDDEVSGLALHRHETLLPEPLARRLPAAWHLALPLPSLAAGVQRLEHHLRSSRVPLGKMLRVAHEEAPHRLLVRPRAHPQATVLERCRVERQPEPQAGWARRGVQEGGVLVGRHLAPDLRLLEYIHGLWDDGVSVPQLLHEVGDLLRVAVGPEGLVHDVQPMSNLVQCSRLGDVWLQLPLCSSRSFLQEEVYAVCAVQEVVGGALVSRLMLLVRHEDGRQGLVGVPLADELLHTLLKSSALIRRGECLDVQESVPLEVAPQRHRACQGKAAACAFEPL